MPIPTPEGWSEWQTLPCPHPFDSASLAETLDGGQAFRWTCLAEGNWEGVFADLVARLHLDPTSGSLGISLPKPLLCAENVARVARYLGRDTDWKGLVDALPWRSDPHLHQAIAAFPGLRILRQPMEEALLGFLCSATKRIIQIRQMCALLARNTGVEIAPGVHRLPTFREIAAAGPERLNGCLLGFRAKYILATARFLAERPGWLEETEQLPYPEAKIRLRQLPGVGEKVADCVLLFGAGKLEAFPVDTWISQTLAHRYHLTGWTNSQLAEFGRAHFGPAAGLAQQFLFSWERRFGRP